MTRVIVGEFIKGEKYPKVIGVGETETKGLRHGYVVHLEDAAESVKRAVEMAEKTSGIKIRRAYIGVGGTSLRGELGTGMAIVSKADGEVTNLDVTKAMDEAEENLGLGNKKVIHSYPVSFKLDGKEVWGRIEGMRGTKLELKALFMTCSNQHVEDLVSVVTMAGIEPIDLVASPIAASYIALSDKQKVAGCALVNIGAETVTMIVFENEIPISLRTFSIGSADITNDIALGFKIPLEKANALKLGQGTEEYSKKKLEEIMNARVSDIFELIETHLKKIKRSELLPAGIIFIGGGANTNGIEQLSRDTLRLPSSVGTTEMFGVIKTKLRDPAYFTALGLILSGKNDEGYNPAGNNSLDKIWKELKSSIKSGFQQLMP